MKRLFRDSWSRIASTSAALIAVIALLAPCAAHATLTPYVLKLTQRGPNVVAVGDGEFDLTGLTYQGWLKQPNIMAASVGYIDVGSLGANVDGYTGASGPSSFGSGGTTPATSGFGDNVGFAASSPSLFEVPKFYVSGTDLASGATWGNASFASLGITPGTYTWKWGSAADQSFTLDAFTSVPEPAALGMFGFGLLLLGGLLTLRGRQTGCAC